MQKLDDNIVDADLQDLVNKLEQKVNMILSINNEQAATIKRLKKENVDLKKQSYTGQIHFGVGPDKVKEITTYISYIDKCIEFLENHKGNNE